MPVSDAYATLAMYKSIVGKTSAGDDAIIPDDLMAVSRYLDWKLERFFTKDAAAVARTYLPSVYTDSLVVDDIASTAGLTIKVDTNRDGSFTSETAFGASDYQLWPLNAATGPEPKPWTKIVIPPWSTRGNFMPGYMVEVTSVGGFPAIPKAIERMTCHLTGILRVESPRATQRIPEAMDRAFSASPRAIDIIAELMAAYARPTVFS